MRTILSSFLQMIKFVRKDKMLFAAMIAPLLAGIAIHFGVPVAEKELIHMTGIQAVLSPYYGLFDVFFAMITPVMFCFIAAMVMLEEHDDFGSIKEAALHMEKLGITLAKKAYANISFCLHGKNKNRIRIYIRIRLNLSGIHYI